ncbi:MAG: iron complex outerrane recepter protein [Chthoniobacter sp.]|nr:iron complex outerrane recepter protein [Chthoniobacter sp.]
MDVRVTTVSRGESTVGESPAAIFVVTPEMIRRSGATNIPELLRMVPGLEVGHIDSSKWGVASRGFNTRFANKLLVQVDGRTVYTPVNGGVYWDTVDYPFEDIERIEVVRGPGASVWGANAVNGIINIITKSAKETQGVLWSAGGGSEERAFSTFRFGGMVGDNLYYRVYGKWLEHDRGFNLDGDARDDWRAGRFGFRLDWKPNRNDTITFEGDYYHGLLGRRDLRASTETPPTFIRTNTEDEEPLGGDVLLRWTHELGKDSNWVLQTYYDYSDRRGTAGTFDFTVNTIDVDFQHQFPLGDRQKVIWGLEYRLTEILWKGSATGFDQGLALAPDREFVQRNLFSVFLQDEIKIVEDRLFLTLGSKFEHNEITGFEYQPTGRLLWTPTKLQSAWASVSRAVRTPTFLDNDLQLATLPLASGTPFFGQLRNNHDLDSEAVIAYELGYRAQATDKLSFDGALFFNRYDRLLVSQPGLPTVDPATGASVLPLDATNGEDADTYGVELAVTWKLAEWWRIFGQYTYLKMNLHADQKLPPASRAGAELVEKQNPQNQFYIRSSWDLPRHFEFDLVGRYVDELDGFTPGIQSYFTMDARLAWKPRENLELALVGQNLFDNHHPELGTSLLVRSPLVEVERSIYGKVTVQW